ncbi:hypothetical protein HYW17_02705 [Candidatus Uhrbacteria bacterium]|nr:hypothetical protein [Candidatus Uhrbacteria bacterium]
MNTTLALQPTASGRTTEQERVLLAVIANGGVWPASPEPISSRRRRRRAPKPVSNSGQRRLVSGIAPLPAGEGLIADAIADEQQAQEQPRPPRVGIAAFKARTASARSAPTVMVSSGPRFQRVRRRKGR